MEKMRNGKAGNSTQRVAALAAGVVQLCTSAECAARGERAARELAVVQPEGAPELVRLSWRHTLPVHCFWIHRSVLFQTLISRDTPQSKEEVRAFHCPQTTMLGLPGFL